MALEYLLSAIQHEQAQAKQEDGQTLAAVAPAALPRVATAATPVATVVATTTDNKPEEPPTVISWVV